MHEPEKNTNYWGKAAAGILPVARDTGRLLVALRSLHVREPFTFGTIGGKIDDHEDTKLAALREFEEETGYKGSIELIPAFRFQDGHFSYQNYIGVVPSEFKAKSHPRHKWESVGFYWMSLEQLHSLPRLHKGLRSLLQDDPSYDVIQRLASK